MTSLVYSGQQPHHDQHQDDDQEYVDQVAARAQARYPPSSEKAEQPEDQQDDNEGLEHGGLPPGRWSAGRDEHTFGGLSTKRLDT
jgi:hypothetical protein